MAINRVWRFALLVAVFPALLAALGCAGGDGSSGPGPALQLAQLINENRSNPMTWDGTIAGVEQAHAEWLSQQPPAPYTLSYREEGEDGKMFADRLSDAGITPSESKEYGYSDENLSNADLVWQQLQSTDICDDKWDKFGIGFVAPPGRESGKRYWVIGVIDE